MIGTDAGHVRSCSSHHDDSFGRHLRQVVCEECEEESSDQPHVGELGEDVIFESKLLMMRKPKQISALYCISCCMWLSGVNQMIDHVNGGKHRKNVARWMQFDLNAATPAEPCYV